MSWTDERIQELTSLWQEGLSASEIGKRMGVSKNSIVGKAHRLNLPSRPSPIKQQGHEPGAESPDSGEEAPRRNARKANSKSNEKRTKKPAKNTANGSKTKTANESNQAVPVGAQSFRAQVEALGGRSGCLWPIGDPNDPEFHFCGASAAPGKPYCAEHAARAYITRNRGDRDDQRNDEYGEEAA